MRKSLISIAALAVAATSAPAFAQEADDSITISGEATVVSDYRFRGLSLSDEDFAIQGAISVAHDSGLYIGTWGSSLAEAGDLTDTYGAAEIDVFGGFATDLTENISADVGVTYYLYPNATDGGDYDYVEMYASLGTTVGPVDASVGAAFAPDQDSIGDASALYLWTDAGVGIPNTPISLSGHLGYAKSDGGLASGLGNQSASDHDYFDWSLGASVSYDALTFGVAYVDTDLGDVDGVDAGVVFSLSAGF